MLALLLAACIRPPVDLDTVPDFDEPPDVSADHVFFGFSWVDDHLAVMPMPREDDLHWMASFEGVEMLVTLTSYGLDETWLASSGLPNVHLPISDFRAPTDEQVDTFIALMDEHTARGEQVGVHCLAGRGRSGTMAAMWFVYGGMTADEAMAHVRDLRPGSIESDEQEASIHRYQARLAGEEVPPEP